MNRLDNKLLDNAKNFIDPATNFIRSHIDNIQNQLLMKKYVLIGLREWTLMYAEGLTRSQYNKRKRFS